MRRYAVVCKGMTLAQCQAACLICGARNLVVAAYSGLVFCDLEEEAAQRLAQQPGITVRTVGPVYTGDAWPMVVAPPVPPAYAPQPIYAASQSSLATLFYEGRQVMSPPFTGAGRTIAILDTGIRASHRGLAGKVVHQVDFTGSPHGPQDVYDHGTGVAYMAAGGRHGPGEESGLAPGAWLMNLKCLGDDGLGTDEAVILGLEEVLRLRQEGLAAGKDVADPLVPNIVNLSLGREDTGDPDDPMRVACRACYQAGMGVVAAAGNVGPAYSSIMSPAADPLVVAVGVVALYPPGIWEHSGRGPSNEGAVKPDVVAPGVSVLVASARGDDAFVVKSGTSFAAPAISGMAALAHEAYDRVYGQRISPEQAWRLLPSITRKPPGAPRNKDNDYGWGMPYGDLAFGRSPPSMVEQLVPVLAAGLALPLAAGVVRAARQPAREGG